MEIMGRAQLIFVRKKCKFVKTCANKYLSFNLSLILYVYVTGVSSGDGIINAIVSSSFVADLRSFKALRGQ